MTTQRKRKRADSQHLEDFLKERNINAAQFAQETGYSSSAVSEWLTGLDMPQHIKVIIDLWRRAHRKASGLTIVSGRGEDVDTVKALAVRLGLTVHTITV